MAGTKSEAKQTDDRRRDAEGRILCEDCLIDGRGADCESCGGSGLHACERFGCKEPARIEGAGGLFVYCSVEHGHEDGDWPSCLCCSAKPQMPGFSPLCSTECESKFLGAIHANQLARWREKVALENAAHDAAAAATRFREA